MLRSAAVIVALMAVVGWPSLAMPFRGDQALFAVVAEELGRGAVLYRDHWDITNPGVFWFYQVAGSLFGFTEEGIRLFEWLWVTGLVVVAAEATRRGSGGDRLPLAAVLFVGVPYYLAGYANTSALTKTEGLVGLPMFLAIWLSARAAGRDGRVVPLLVVAGFAGGMVVLFKVMLAGLLGVVWLYLAVEFVRTRGHRLKSLLTFVAGLTLGLSLALGPAVGYFAAHGMLEEAARTLFVMPPRFLAEGERAGIDRLAESTRWFLGQYAPVLAAAVLATACQLRVRRDPVAIALGLALLASFGVLLAQRLSWWSYHFVLPGTLAGALAAYGLPAVSRAITDRLGRVPSVGERAVVAVAAGVLFLEPAGGLVYQALKLTGHDFGVTARGRREFREATGTAYRLALTETAWLAEPGVEPGPILVCGDPLFYWLSGRKPAAKISGWSLQMYPDEVRRELATRVKDTSPAYVYVAARPEGYDELIARRYPDLSAVLKAEYVSVRRSVNGVWYARVTSPTPASPRS